MKIQKLWNYLVDLFFPRKCPFCLSIIDSKHPDLCPKCRKNLPWRRESEPDPPEWISDVYALLSYRGNVRHSIHRYKFGNCYFYHHVYGQELAELLKKRSKQDWDLITWVPLSKKRLKERGYDQSELLARTIGAVLNKEVVPLLRKKRNIVAQSSLSSAEARRANIQGVYEALEHENAKGKIILLVDDVLTTGATSSQCALMLCGEGAQRIDLAVVARAGSLGRSISTLDKP